MTRTPTTPVTAIAIAARAFAWGMLPSGRLSDPALETPLSLLH